MYYNNFNNNDYYYVINKYFLRELMACNEKYVNMIIDFFQKYLLCE